MRPGSLASPGSSADDTSDVREDLHLGTHGGLTLRAVPGVSEARRRLENEALEGGIPFSLPQRAAWDDISGARDTWLVVVTAGDERLHAALLGAPVPEPGAPLPLHTARGAVPGGRDAPPRRRRRSGPLPSWLDRSRASCASTWSCSIRPGRRWTTCPPRRRRPGSSDGTLPASIAGL
jgi:hypothetical protein